jgi:hypothetical protein
VLTQAIPRWIPEVGRYILFRRKYATMKKVLFFALALQAVAVFGAPLGGEQSTGKILYVYDKANEQSAPYVTAFRDAFATQGFAVDEATAAELKSKNLAAYDRLVLHGMVMAFNSMSPLRDWLKTGPDLSGKKVSLLVTANRWFLADLFGQLVQLLKKDKAELVDAVSMATKTTTPAEEAAAVLALVKRLPR